MKIAKLRPTGRTPISKVRCNFHFADGRRCRMLRHNRRDHLCLFHTRELLQLKSSAELGAELLALGGNFQNPIAINLVLGKLFAAVATGRMHRRDASTLAYIAQLLLQTIDQKKYQRIRDQYDYRGFTAAIDAKYPRRTRKRPSRSIAPATVTAAPSSPLAQPDSPTPETPTPHLPALDRTTSRPSPANLPYPEPLPDTPWFRNLVHTRKGNAGNPPDQTLL